MGSIPQTFCLFQDLEMTFNFMLKCLTFFKDPFMRLVFTDLDDTLFATARHHTSVEGLPVASITKEGEPSGYQSQAHQDIWNWVQQFGDVVPVTARTKNALDRVNLPFSPHRVWNSGLSVQIDGMFDQLWHDQMVQVLEKANTVMAPLWADIRAFHATSQEHLVIPNEFDGLVCQWGLRAPTPEIAREVKRALRERLAAENLQFWVHDQSEKWLYITPNGMGKQYAVRHVLDTLNPQTSVGVGDNPSDIPFMRLCDYTLFPSQCLALTPLNT